jgi:hypothetical protein
MSERITAEAAVELFRDSPKLDWSEVRDDLDEYVDQDIEPRS